MAALCAWTLASALWSGAPARALLEFDSRRCSTCWPWCFRGCWCDRPPIRWLGWGLATASVVVCAAGVVTGRCRACGMWRSTRSRRAASVSPSATGTRSASWPGIGIVLCASITTGRREPRPARVLAAAAIPLLATALLLHVSRGALLATAVGLVAFVLVGRPRALLCGLAAPSRRRDSRSG